MRITLLPKGRTCQGTRQAHLYRHQYLASGAFPMGGVVETRKAPSARGLMLSICYQNVVPKVKVELTRGHPHWFLSLMRVVLNSVDLVQQPEYLPVGVRA